MGDVVRLNYESPTFREAANRLGFGSLLDQLIKSHNALVSILQGGTAVLKSPALSNTTTALAIGATPYAIAGVVALRAAGTVALTTTTHNVAQNKYAAFRVSVASGGAATITKGSDQDTLALAQANLPAVPANQADFGSFVVRGGTSAGFVAGTTNLQTAAIAGMVVTYFPASTPIQTLTNLS